MDHGTEQNLNPDWKKLRLLTKAALQAAHSVPQPAPPLGVDRSRSNPGKGQRPLQRGVARVGP